MYFTPRVTSRARDRQSKMGSWGSWCARCGEFINPLLKERRTKGGWYAVPRVPKELGGRRTIDNCVILCPKCWVEIGKDNTKEIPYSMLPYFSSSPPTTD